MTIEDRYEEPTPGATDEEERNAYHDVPAPEQTIAGPTYDNPNEDQTYVPPEVEPAVESNVDVEGRDSDGGEQE